MVKLHGHNVTKHGLDASATDRRISVSRCGLPTRTAIKSADQIARRVCVVRTLFVFVDDHKTPDRLACVVFALGDHTTLIATVDDNGKFAALNRYAVRSDKRLSQEWLYKYLGITFHKNDVQRERYHTRIYVRNRTCYK